LGQSKAKLEHRNRNRVYLGTVDLNELIEAGHPAQAVWALLEGMDFSRYEEQIRSREEEAGRRAVPPRQLAALWIYGYSLGVGSARALERMQESLRELARGRSRAGGWSALYGTACSAGLRATPARRRARGNAGRGKFLLQLICMSW
jgi:hypothetical protein